MNIDSKHILFGILGLQESVAKSILIEYGFDAVAFEPEKSDSLLNDKEAKAVLRICGEQALRDSAFEAFVWRADIISPIHVLLSILRRKQDQDPGYRDLRAANLSYKKLQVALLSFGYPPLKFRSLLSDVFHLPYLRSSVCKRWIAPLA